jgi:hypothetical protein
MPKLSQFDRSPAAAGILFAGVVLAAQADYPPGSEPRNNPGRSLAEK